jgi:hypothetical protein
MLPKSRRRIYLGFDDGAKAVKYYNAETQNILTSRNFRNINPPPETPPEPIIIAPSEQHEGEPGKKDMLLPAKIRTRIHPINGNGKGEKKKCLLIPCKTRGICTDYKQLSN